MVHNIMKEEDTEVFCPYCKNEIVNKKFKVELIEGITYKTTKCKCGKDVRIKTNREIYNYKDGEGNLLIERIKFEDEEILKEKGRKKEER